MCLGCGLCIGPVWESGVIFCRVGKSTYLRAVYYREHMRYLQLRAPIVPDDILLLVASEAKKAEVYGPISKFSKVHIRLILSAVEVPKNLQVEYKSVKRPQNRFNERPMTSLSRYTKKWRYIIWALNEYPDDFIPPIDEYVQNAMCEVFDTLARIQLIYKKNKKHGICYLLTIAKIMQLVEWREVVINGGKPLNLLKTYGRWLPLQSSDKIKIGSDIINKIMIHTGWVDPIKYPRTNDPRHPLNTLYKQSVVTFNLDGGKKQKHVINTMY